MSVEPIASRRVAKRNPSIEARVSVLEREMDAVKATLATVDATSKEAAASAAQAVANTEAILAVVSGGKSIVKFAQKHGGRFIAFVVGLLVASGKLDAAIAVQIKSLLGL